jgi:nitroimidazol reductase NimA-like FMN-containing flavoprotein (pyridoxamine 5'-phosphate oxidase superfamily)
MLLLGYSLLHRTMTGQLTQVEMDNLLHSQLIGRLACIQGDVPYIVPMAFAYDGTNILGQTGPGLKLRILRKNPRVCFEVDQLIDLRNWKSVIVFGMFQESDTNQLPQSRQWLFDRIYPLSTPSQVHSHGHFTETQLEDNSRVKPVLFRIEIQRMTGRFERQ